MEDSQEWGQGRIVMAMVGAGLAVLLLLNRDVGHPLVGPRPVPVFLAGREPDHVARSDRLSLAVVGPDEAPPTRHDQALAEGD